MDLPLRFFGHCVGKVDAVALLVRFAHLPAWHIHHTVRLVSRLFETLPQSIACALHAQILGVSQVSTERTSGQAGVCGAPNASRD